MPKKRPTVPRLRVVRGAAPPAPTKGDLLLRAAKAHTAKDWAALDIALWDIQTMSGLDSPFDAFLLMPTGGSTFNEWYWYLRTELAIHRGAEQSDWVCHQLTLAHEALGNLVETVERLEASLGAAGAPDPTVREVCQALLAAINDEWAALESIDDDPREEEDEEEA